MMRLGFTFPVSYLVRLCLLSNTPLALPTQEKNINLLQFLVFISHIPKYIQILFPPPPLGHVFVTLFIKIFFHFIFNFQTSQRESKRTCSVHAYVLAKYVNLEKQNKQNIIKLIIFILLGGYKFKLSQICTNRKKITTTRATHFYHQT